jgi:hypothetical protein
VAPAQEDSAAKPSRAAPGQAEQSRAAPGQDEQSRAAPGQDEQSRAAPGQDESEPGPAERDQPAGATRPEEPERPGSVLAPVSRAPLQPTRAAGDPAGQPGEISWWLPDKTPSWPTVIATTLRLWLRRHVPRRRTPAGQETAGRTGASRRLVLLCVALALVAAAAVIAAIQVGSNDRAGGQAAESQRQAAALAAAAASRQQAAAWIEAEVSPSAVVSCDQAMCAALQADGFPNGNLVVLTPSSTDPLGSAIVVSTAAIRSQFGTHLASVYAPEVIASFGRGTAMVQVRVIAPDGAQAYELQQNADLLARQQVGQQLTGNKNLQLSQAARRDLTGGLVDPRLMAVLATLSHSYPVDIAGFSDQGPGAEAGTPLRAVEISAEETAGQDGHSYLDSVRAFLDAQIAPYRASMTVLGTGNTALIRIQFDAPSPLSTLNTGSP